MTDEMIKFKRACHELFNIAFKLKKHNHDLFVEYSPHAYVIHWKLYIDGWSEEKSLNSNYVDGRFYVDYVAKHTTIDASMNELKKHIKGLLNENNKRN